MGLIHDIAKDRSRFSFLSPDRWGTSVLYEGVAVDANLGQESVDIFDGDNGRTRLRVIQAAFSVDDMPSPMRGQIVTVGDVEWSLSEPFSIDMGLTIVRLVRPERIHESGRRLM